MQSLEQRARLAAKLAAVPGLEPELGLAMLGRREDTYLRLLGRIAARQPDYAADLRAQVANGNRTNARHTLHKLKAVSGIVGAIPVYRLATRLESVSAPALPDGQFWPQVHALAAQWATLIGGLRACLPGDTGKDCLPVGEHPDIAQLLDRLERQCACGEFTEIKAARQALPTLLAIFGKTAQPLANHLERTDHAAALAALHILRARQSLVR